MNKLTSLIAQGFNRRQLAMALGALWLLDGLLQLQPQMLTSALANQVLSASAQGQPGVVSGPINQLIRMVLLNPAGFDWFVVLAQLALGLLILWPKSRRFGLALSVIWSLAVWYLGEGLGGLLGGQTSLLVGAPGAALLYAVLALAAWPKHIAKAKVKVTDRPPKWLNLAWAAVWLLGAVYQLLPGQNSPFNIASTITAAANGAPWWLGITNAHIAVAVNDCGIWLVALLALIQAAIGIGAFMPAYIRGRVIMSGIVVAFVFWFVGQDLGALYSGLGTDSNTGPLLILMGLGLLSAGHLIAWPKSLD